MKYIVKLVSNTGNGAGCLYLKKIDEMGDVYLTADRNEAKEYSLFQSAHSAASFVSQEYISNYWCQVCNA
jgi:hypothetical protein